MNVSIGICAYNEGKNIVEVIESLLNQKTQRIQINEIIIVSSGSTDQTDYIAEKYSKKYKFIKLIKQEKREGKASAINILLKNAKCDVMVLESADTIPTPEAIETLVLPFFNTKIGMTGGHPVPTNDKSNFIGYTVNLLWELHHDICVRNPENPKLGELVAFRMDLIDAIDKNTAVDEAWIQALVKQKGFALKYVPDAIVYNKGPENISDFLKQRRRICAGHIDLEKNLRYRLSTIKVVPIFQIIKAKLGFGDKYTIWMVGAIFLEGLGRFLGFYDYYIKKKKHCIWDIAESTKKLANELPQ